MLVATPVTGVMFAVWSGACICTCVCGVTMDAVKSPSATLFRSLTVTLAGGGGGTVMSSPAGITCGATCTAAFSRGAVVTLTATPLTGAMFAGWSGACTGTGPCGVTMDAVKTVTATFSYPLTVTL